MPNTDSFSQQLDQLLAGVSGASLPELQQTYREVIVRMGLHISEKYQQVAVFEPDRVQLAGTGVIHGPGPRHDVLLLAEFALNLRGVAGR
jgi:hypothetical protein